MYNIIAIYGESGVGKDYIKKQILKKFPELHNIISTTTRPKRENEIQDIDYHFCSLEEYTEELLNGNLIEGTVFNNWGYGTNIKDLNENKINIGIFNLDALRCLEEDSRLNLFLVKVSASDKNRLIRSLSREDNPDCKEICRRFLADKKDFELKEPQENNITINNDKNFILTDDFLDILLNGHK